MLAFGAALALGLTASAAEVYDAVEEGDGIAGLDQPVLDTAIDLRTPGRADAVTWFTDLGGETWFPVVAVVVLGAIAIRWRTWSAVLLPAVGFSVALAMTWVGKVIVGRARPPYSEAVPPYETSASFPSGHSLLATVLAALVGYLLLQRVRRGWLRGVVVGLCTLWAVAMGLSRVYLGHHWFTDVCAGWALGLAWTAALITAHQTWLLVRRSQDEPGEVP
ncbi:hypothetical protein VV01_04465 [Luteipulveratus halotolerans]|uniref:Phosphatidic acid phosphatase type 2/haloperoxidase domain-containing protein n=1 Tax=Luteipulveratus halotolerans TaxID=1631356 RepID=A0A0L6CN98_9MICO|nr:hypothetical protein VV01_04465 [Luteipulveratus halotolerans]